MCSADLLNLLQRSICSTISEVESYGNEATALGMAFDEFWTVLELAPAQHMTDIFMAGGGGY